MSKSRITKVKTNIKPLRTALSLSLLYGVVCLIYIHFSSNLAAAYASNWLELENIERVKGSLFVILTTILIFSLVFIYLRRLKIRSALIKRQELALFTAENKALASMFALSVAHDIKNILSFMDMGINEIREGKPAADELEDILDNFEEVNEQLKDLAMKLSNLSDDNSKGLKNFDLSRLIRKVVVLMKIHQDTKFCKITVDIPEKLKIVGDEFLIKRTVINLMLNSGQALYNKGEIAIKVSEGKDEVKIEVHDDGPGIKKELMNKILEPLYTTKENGFGLGLLTLTMCAEKHRGTFEIGDSKLGGALFAFTLKMKEKDQEQENSD
ncbi:MAG: HAMP domain-containing sensor histidine kinase [Deltaproteobacteria bacterium]|jgi:signal transduction histidine kinase|nr:HAMP domain-containing sensor histidine kinase [Deltaproteobacteria bacterium]